VRNKTRGHRSPTRIQAGTIRYSLQNSLHCQGVHLWRRPGLEAGPFGRAPRHLVNALAELEALGLTFISLRDNLDLSTPSGRLMFQIIGAMAEFERSLIQERVKAGLRNARAKSGSRSPCQLW
jgi:hypothetical protein